MANDLNLILIIMQKLLLNFFGIFTLLTSISGACTSRICTTSSPYSDKQYLFIVIVLETVLVDSCLVFIYIITPPTPLQVHLQELSTSCNFASNFATMFTCENASMIPIAWFAILWLELQGKQLYKVVNTFDNPAPGQQHPEHDNMKGWSHYGQWRGWGHGFFCDIAHNLCPQGGAIVTFWWPALDLVQIGSWRAPSTFPPGVFSFLHFIENIDIHRHFYKCATDYIYIYMLY